MADDFTRTDDIQLAANPGQGADCAQAGDGAEDCVTAGGGAQAVVAVAQPADGAEVSLAATAGQVYDLRFDPRQAEVRVIDADGDGDLDMVLVFNAGTAAESRIVFQDMVEAAQSGNPPLLQSGGSQFGADAVVQQAQALAGEQPTLETAAPGNEGPAGTGVTQYDDDLGSSLELLDAQGVIPPVEMSFPSLEPTTDSDAPLDVPAPTVEARIGAGAEFAPVVMKEDAAGGFDGDDFVGDPDTLVSFSAEASNGFLTTIVVTGFDNVAGWDFDMSLVEAAVLDLGGSFSFDGATLTIDLSGLGQTAFASAFAANPPEDSDVDLGTLTIEANAVSDLDPSQTGDAVAEAEVQVDAVLDEALELGADGVNGGAESDSAQTFSLNLDSSPVAPFAGSGDGGADTDGSESTVVLLTLDAPLPEGASLSSTAGTVTPTGNPNEYAVTGADLEAAVDGLQVTVPPGFDCTISGTLTTTSTEANTPEGAAPASGQEPDTSDNLWTDSVDFTVTVTPGEVAPQAAIGLPTGVAAIKEDSSDNTVEFSAQSGDATDELTSVVIELPGVAAGDVDVSQIESESGVDSVTVVEAGGTTTITIAFEDAAGLTSFSSSFTLDAPMEDGDADLTGVTITANARDITDNDQTGSGGETVTIAVDAVLDEALELGADGVNGGVESAVAQTFSLNLDSSLVAPFAGSGDGGADTDGSESTVVLLTLDAPLPEGASLSSTAGTVTPTGNPNEYAVTGADLEAAVDGLQVTVPPGFDCTISGTLTTTSTEANTPEGAAPASGQEPDTSDNLWTDSVDFTVTVTPGEVAPQAAIGLPTGVAAIKEDSSDNTVEFSAQSGDATDELTTVVIELPGVLSGDVGGFDFGADAGKVASVDISDDGTDTTVTITLNGGVETLSGTFLLDAPVEDSDADLSGVTITANAQDASDNTQTASGGETITIAVDAVLDEAPAVSQASVPEVDESTSGALTVLLGLDFAFVSAGFDNTLPAPATGGDSGDGGSDADGSESVTSVTVSLSDGTLVLDAGYAGSASLTDNGGGNWTLSGWADAADLEAAVEALSVTVAEGFDGTVSGTISTTTEEANTPEGAVPASGQEPDTADNVVSDSFDFSLVVDSVPTAGDLDIAVDEDDLPAGNSDVAAGDDLADPSATVIAGTLDVDFAADAAGASVDFAALDGLAVEDTGGNPVTSGSVALVYDWNAGTNTLTALAGATPVFTVVVTDPSTGAFTFTLLEPIDHPTADREDNLAIAMGFTATDGDGDTASGTLTVDIDDDSPNVVAAAPAILGNDEAGTSTSGALNFFEAVGADRGSDAGVVFVNNEADNRLRGSIDGEAEQVLTSNGHAILLAGFGGTTLQGFVDLNDNGLIDDGPDSLILQVDLNPDADDESLDTYTVELFGMIDNGEQITFDDFSGISGNNNVFFPLDSSNDPSAAQDLLITATVPGTSTVNTDNDDIGSGDQWLNSDDTPVDGEIIRLDYVENVSGNPDDINSLSYSHHYVVNDAGFRVHQLQGNSSISRSVLVRVYDEDDDPQGSNFATAGAGDPAEQDDITSVRVEAGDGTYAAAYDGVVYDGVANVIADDRITFTFNADGSVTIDGLLTDDQVFVSTEDGFTQMEVQNVTSGGNLGIALDNFVIGTQQSGDPIDLSFDLEVTDSDGDTNDGTLDVTLLPQLDGEAGVVNDVLVSNGDGEILIGGLGDDTLTGGGEGDIFVFNLGVDDGADTITDFDGAEDALWFTDVVDGAGDDLQDVDDMIASIVDNGGGDVQVNFTSGGSIDFEGIAFVGQTSIADLVDSGQQITVDHA